jgi:hypothetical protein
MHPLLPEGSWGLSFDSKPTEWSPKDFPSENINIHCPGDEKYQHCRGNTREESMSQPDRSYLVPGKLIDQQKILHEVELVIVTKLLPSPRSVEIETLSEIRLARRSPVPDGGSYMLQYEFHGIKHDDQVHIRLGKLITV